VAANTKGTHRVPKKKREMIQKKPSDKGFTRNPDGGVSPPHQIAAHPTKTRAQTARTRRHHQPGPLGLWAVHLEEKGCPPPKVGVGFEKNRGKGGGAKRGGIGPRERGGKGGVTPTGGTMPQPKVLGPTWRHGRERVFPKETQNPPLLGHRRFPKTPRGGGKTQKYSENEEVGLSGSTPK